MDDSSEKGDQKYMSLGKEVIGVCDSSGKDD